MNHNTRNFQPCFAGMLSIVMLCVLALAGCSILPGSDRSLTPTPTIRAASGGQVLSEDGGARLEIPPQALPGDTAISVDALEISELLTAWPFAASYLGAARFEPHGLQFSQPVTATFILSRPQPPGKALDLFYNPEEDGSYIYLGPRAMVDEGGITASALIEHFSTYVVAEPPAQGYPVIVVVGLTLNGAAVLQSGPGNPAVQVTAFEQTVSAVDGGGGLYVALLSVTDLPLLVSQGGHASAVYLAPGSGDGGEIPYVGGTQWNSDAWQIVPNPATPLEQVASALAGQLFRVATATQIAGAVGTVLNDAVLSQSYLLVAAAVHIDLHPANEVQGALDELDEQLNQLLALREALINNNCPLIPAQVQIAWNAALQAQQTGNPGQIQNALHQIELALAAIVEYLAHPFSPGMNPDSANPGEMVAISGVPTAHKCSGATLNITVQSDAGNAAGGQLTIARPKAAGGYPVEITVRESILGIETQGNTSIEVLNVAPKVVTNSNAAGLPGEAALFRNRVEDDNAELATEVLPMPLAGSALGVLENVHTNFVPYPGGGILIVRGRIKDPQADGQYELNVQFRDQAGLVSNVMPDGLDVGNVPPELRSLSVSPQVIPPSAEIPTLVEVRARFSDRNGLGDIRKVTLILQALGVTAQVISQNPVTDPAGSEVVFAFQATGPNGSVRVIASVEDEAAMDSQEKVLQVVNLPPDVAISGCTSVPYEGMMTFGVQVRDPNGDPLSTRFESPNAVIDPVPGTSTPGGWTNFIVTILPPPPGSTPRFLITAGGHTVAVECGRAEGVLLPTISPTPTPTLTPTAPPTEMPPHPTQPLPIPSQPAPVETTAPLPGEKP